MKIKSITAASVIISIAASAMGVLAVIVSQGEWWIALAIAIGVFGILFACSFAVIRKFVIYKLKPIYQIVLARDIKTKELERRFSHAENIVDEIEGEISNWAETSRREIARLKDNEKYRKEYVGNVSHEIKTPIFNIQGYILTLLDGGLEDSNVNRMYLERAEKSIDRLINIVTDLEEISKLESGVLKLKLERFDAVALAKEAVESLEMEAARKNIRISITGSGNFQVPAIYVKADKHYINQVFINLLTNSIKYGNEGGRTKIAFIDLFDKIMIEVSDNGAGIAKEDIPRIFERFYRTDKSRSREQGGTGLGLSIVKHIVEAHKESITLRSEQGKGSTFSFTLNKG